ncbi:hypothetical protein MED222_06335 [Vibrio sp. MED222]|nr:hypothetical protein MED222_06335 [Vibrio sp. MED222]
MNSHIHLIVLVHTQECFSRSRVFESLLIDG